MKPIDIVIVAHAVSWDEIHDSVRAITTTTQVPHRLLVATTQLRNSEVESTLKKAGVVEIIYNDAKLPATLRNHAIRAATSDLIALIDASTRPQEFWLERLVEIASDPNVGIVGAVTVRDQSEEVLQAGIHFNHALEPLYLGREEFLSFLKLDEVPTRPPAVSASCMLLKRAAVDAASGFDERYRNFDDIDLCLRVRVAGYEVALSSGSIVFQRAPSMLQVLEYRRDDLQRLKELISNPQTGALTNLRMPERDLNARPLVSLLYPAYNDASFLEQNIESIINQTYDNWELIVVDDASSDETPVILNRFQSAYPDRIRILNKENHNRFDAWAMCYAESRGEYLAILGADDVLLPWCVEEQVRNLEAHSSAAFVYGDVYRFDDKGKLIEHQSVDEPNPEFQLTHLLACNYLFTPSILMRRSAVEAAGGWLNREFMYSQDYDLWLRLLYVGEQKHIERTSIKYRVHAAQLTAVIGTDRMFVSGAAVIRDKLAKWRPEEVFRGLDLNSGAGQVAAYQEINKMLFSPQTAVCGVELDVLKFFGSLIDRPAIDLEARKAKFTLLHGAIALLRQRGHYGSAAEQLWRALRAGAAFEKSLYRILWRKSRELMPKPKARQVSNQS